MIKFLGHAGFLYETNNEIILMDPWMSKEGAFDSSWYQFPSNHDLGDEIREIITDTNKEIYIYISHEHKDHFDVPYLRTLELQKINFITPKFRRDHVASVLHKLNPKSVTTPIDSEIINIGNLEIRLFLDDQEIVRDSALGLIDKDKDFTFLNLNDCKVYDRVDELKEIFGKFNVFTCQFSGAVFHPVCYDYPEKKYNEISESKVLGKFGSVKTLLNKFEPELYIPAAGPPVFLDPNLVHINYQEINIFSSPFKFKKYLNEELPNLNVEVPVPGSKFYIENNNIGIEHPVKDVESMFSKENIATYAKNYEYIFEDREKRKNNYVPETVQKLLLEELASKLENFDIKQKMNAIMKFNINEITDKSIILDFDQKKVNILKNKDNEIDVTYEISCSAVGKVLPSLNGKLDGIALRVPVACGSITDFVCITEKQTTSDEVNNFLKNASNTSMQGVLAVSNEPLVSIDIVGRKESSIIDAELTKVDGNLIKLVSWYDNESGYSARLIDLCSLIVEKKPSKI